GRGIGVSAPDWRKLRSPIRRFRPPLPAAPIPPSSVSRSRGRGRRAPIPTAPTPHCCRFAPLPPRHHPVCVTSAPPPLTPPLLALAALVGPSANARPIEQVLHSFQGAYPHNPASELIQATDGNFYGTTEYGGANDQGTVFKMTPAGAVTTLVDFTGNGATNKG